MYAEIASNKRKTWVLVTLFSIVVILLATVIGVASGADATSSLVVGTILSVGYSLIAFYTADKTVLMSEGAKKLDKALAPDIYRIVENLAIADGLPMPGLYLIQDDAPNAFATGRDPEHAAIAVTTGLLATLEKPELEGVLAHEFGHIKNFDIRLMTMVVVMVGLLLLLSNILLRLPFSRSRGNNKDAGQIAIVLLIVGIVLGILSPILAQLIKLAISRSREYLADATGALTTRHPEGLARALEKIQAYQKPMIHANRATAHLYISNPFGANGKATSFINRMYSTHPPIADRIAKLRAMAR